MPELRIERGSEPGRVFLLADEAFLGRAPSCVVVIEEQDVSRRHARLFRRDDRFWVEDLGSRNGTALNGKRIEAPTPLSPGDHLRIGRTWLSFAADESADPVKLLQSDYQVEERCPAPYLLYRATQRELARRVSLSVFPSAGRESEVRARFLAMLDSRARLDHRNLQALLDYGFKEEVGYFAAEWTAGPSLSRVLKTHGRLEPWEALRVGAALYDALDQMQQRGSVHGSISPESVRLEGDRPVLTEIGLGELVGVASPDHQPPEGPGTPPADVFSLAAVVVEALLGTSPFAAPTEELSRQRRASADRAPLEAEVRRRASPEAASALVSALSPLVPRRPAAAEMARVLREAAVDARARSAPRVGFLERAALRFLSSRLACWLAFPLAALALLAAIARLTAR